MRYNPCGRIVDIARRPYTTVFRPWEGSADEVEIVWYLVPWSNPVLGMPSRIQSLDWSAFPWAASGVGEVYNAPRVYNGQWSKPFIDGDHVCGTPADFAGHSIKDEALPPVVYNDADLPMCCQPPFVGAGGAVAGGTATVSVASYSHVYNLSQQSVDVDDRLPGGIIGQRWVPLGPPGQSELYAPGYMGETRWRTTYFSICEWFADASWDGHGAQVFGDQVGICSPTCVVTSFD